MLRKMITPDIVAEIERLLVEKIECYEIAKQLGISNYVVEVVAHDDESRNRPAPPLRSKVRIVQPKAGIEFATIRMIERLLSVGVLSYTEIAREVGVSKNTICDVANGRRTAKILARPWLNAGEKFLPHPHRCGICGARLVVIPCRKCRMRREINLLTYHGVDSKGDRSDVAKVPHTS